MAYVVAKKGALLMPSGPGEDGQHLYVIATNACDGDQCLLVTLSSIKPNRFYDPACEIEVGEHDFVTKRSYVEYRMSRILRCDHIVKCVSGWYFTPKSPVADHLFERISEGILASDFTSRMVQSYFETNRNR